MARRNQMSYRRAGASEVPAVPVPFPYRWWGKLTLLLATVVLFSLAFAPFKQFYLAWFALVPWLIVVRNCRSVVTAFLWSWAGGVLFFTANMWWLAYVTGPGMIALMAVLGLYWGGVGAAVRGARLLEPRTPRQTVAGVFLIAAGWAALEWLRGTWPLGGLAWSYLGHSQTPVLAVCQVADVGGVYAVSFWAMAVNAWMTLFLLARLDVRPVRVAAWCVGGLTAVVVGYGLLRLSQHPTVAGPRVLVVQPNYPQSNSGEKGAELTDIVAFHVNATEGALRADPGVNLVVWSETMMPPLNPEAAEFVETLANPAWQRDAHFWRDSDARLASLAKRYNTGLLVGGMYQSDWGFKTVGLDRFAVPRDRRNAAYFYLPAGKSPVRYDKIHLVPFGEYLPFKSAIPPLYRLFLSMSPYPEEYTLTAGRDDAMTVFELKPQWRFVTPICFEDMDGPLLARMFAPGASGRKRADFIVNITNDGWFRYNEMPQHLQAAVFRSIENRVPTARSVNTGISAFIDSDGRITQRLPAGTEGTAVQTLALDGRVTLYTRYGDVFAYACAAATGLLVIASLGRWWKGRRQAPAEAR